ncbi:MAG: hypothetical protein A2820_01335 [Candidatus Buchananbacteria bacterium RIFCSPHIGHO2_01_FULL_40_35]|nr:MAG: hypothetical protein A2820_01335 [Candidatus Buchananbacteria bacterium RIFCSPHIGHO2_01_FULL_40_35]
MLPFIVSATLVIIASFLQTTNAILVLHVKPNLIFILLAVLAHINKSWLARSVVILSSALILKFSPLVTWADVMFISSAFLVMALVDYLPWRRIINSIVAAFAGTVVIGLSYLNLRVLTLETVINTILVIMFFGAMTFVYDKKKVSEKNRF